MGEPHVEVVQRFAMIPEALLYDPNVDDAMVRVYGVLHRHGTDPSNCYPSHARIGGFIGKSKRTVPAIIARLAAAGWVEVIPRKSKHGDWDSNSYRVHAAPVRVGSTRERGVGSTRQDEDGSTRQDAPNESKGEREQEERENETGTGATTPSAPAPALPRRSERIATTATLTRQWFDENTTGDERSTLDEIRATVAQRWPYPDAADSATASVGQALKVWLEAGADDIDTRQALDVAADRIEAGLGDTPSYAGIVVSELIAEHASSGHDGRETHEDVLTALADLFGWSGRRSTGSAR